MSSNQKPEPYSSMAADRWKICIDTHEKTMRKAIKAQTVFDPSKLGSEHGKFYESVCSWVRDDERRHLKEFLNERWCNMVEQEEEKIWQNSDERSNDAQLCLYLTDEWIHAAGYTEKMGNIDINFGDSKPGLSARIKHSNGKLAWTDENNNLVVDNPANLTDDDLTHHITQAMWGNETSKKLITQLFYRVKETSEEKLEDSLSQVMLVTPNYFDLRYRTILRESCKNAGFKRISMLDASSLAALRIFASPEKHPSDLSLQTMSVLVVNIGSNLKIFGCQLNEEEIVGVQLLAAAYAFPSKESLKIAYGNALEQMPLDRRNTVRYYLVFNELNYRDYHVGIVDELFRDEEMLNKAENIPGYKLREALSFFSSNPGNLGRFLETFASTHIQNSIVSENKLEPDAVIQEDVVKDRPVSLKEAGLKERKSIISAEKQTGIMQLIRKCCCGF